MLRRVRVRVRLRVRVRARARARARARVERFCVALLHVNENRKKHMMRRMTKLASI